MERIDPVDRCAHEQRVKSVTSHRPCRTSPHSILASGGPARLAWLAAPLSCGVLVRTWPSRCCQARVCGALGAVEWFVMTALG